MLRRRIIGSFTWLLTLQVVLVGSGLICPSHGGRGTQLSAATPQSAAHVHHSGTPGHRRAPTDLPGTPECCLAMTTCSATVALAGGLQAPLLVFAHAGPIASGVAQAASRVDSPDPPPPKA